MRLNRRILSRRSSRPKSCRLGCWFYVFVLCVFCFLASIPLLIFYDAVLVELHLADHSNSTTRNILFMGWVTSLNELNRNWVLEKEMEEYCSTYDPTKSRGYGYREGHEGGMHVHVFYREENVGARHEIQAVLSQQGCSSSFTHEQSQSPIDHDTGAAKTKAYEREIVLQDNIQYDAVVNIDLDGIVSLPSLSSFENALEHAINEPGAVICANEAKTSTMLIKQFLWWRQRSRRVEATPPPPPPSQQEKTPLQSAEACGEGFAMYSWKAWSSDHCNFFNGDETSGETEAPSWLRTRSKDRGAHVIFQQCLKAWHDETWIGVQPDLVIWRRLWWCPWVTLLCLVLLGSLAWELLSAMLMPSAATGRMPGIQTLFRSCTNFKQRVH